MVKCIGFDCTEDHRVGSGGTYATGKMSICPRDGLPAYSDRYEIDYPLRRWGMDRKACGQAIVDAGLPLPPKSACFFCPAMRDVEILRLAKVDPDFHKLALEMERLYRSGEHFRGDDTWTVKGVRKDTGEKVEIDVVATSAAEARDKFRRSYNDTASPHRWKLQASQAVVGLGRNRKWSEIEAGSQPMLF